MRDYVISFAFVFLGFWIIEAAFLYEVFVAHDPFEYGLDWSNALFFFAPLVPRLLTGASLVGLPSVVLLLVLSAAAIKCPRRASQRVALYGAGLFLIAPILSMGLSVLIGTWQRELLVFAMNPATLKYVDYGALFSDASWRFYLHPISLQFLLSLLITPALFVACTRRPRQVGLPSRPET